MSKSGERSSALGWSEGSDEKHLVGSFFQLAAAFQAELEPLLQSGDLRLGFGVDFSVFTALLFQWILALIQHFQTSISIQKRDRAKDRIFRCFEMIR